MTVDDDALTDMELASLVASKICHDVVGPVGAICNGLEILDMDPDEESKASALDVIRSVSEQASARLQFARYAYGASGATGSLIDLGTAEQVSRGLVGHGKHKISWRAPSGCIVKDKVKLLLNLVAASITALPRGGDIMVMVNGSVDRPSFLIRCRGNGARPPQHLIEFIRDPCGPGEIDPLTIQAYFTCRLARASGMRLEVYKEAADILLAAQPQR